MKLNKKQKRTATIASMAALLAVVLGMGGQTFAKYYETNTAASTQATVANWGVVVRNSIESKEVTGTQAPIFNTSYDNNAVVSLTDDQDVVAPGTSGGVTVEITGVPEVAVLIATTFTITNDIKLELPNKDVYYPIQWTVKCGTGDEQSYNGVDAATSIKTAVDTYVGTTAKTPTKEGLSYKFTIGWKWLFEVNPATNDLDSIIGDIKAGIGHTDYSLVSDTVGYSVVTEVNQVDIIK